MCERGTEGLKASAQQARYMKQANMRMYHYCESRQDLGQQSNTAWKTACAASSARPRTALELRALRRFPSLRRHPSLPTSMSQMVQVVSMDEVPRRLGSASFQSKEVSGAANSDCLFCVGDVRDAACGYAYGRERGSGAASGEG